MAYTGNDKAIDRVMSCSGSMRRLTDRTTTGTRRTYLWFYQKDASSLWVSALCTEPGSSSYHTLRTKLEFTSTRIKEHFPDDEERPLSKYIEKGPSR